METDTTPLSEQAAHWWIVLHGEGASSADRRAFAEWIAKSPERVEAYLRVTLLKRALATGDVKWPDTPVEDLVREASAEANVHELNAHADDERALARAEAHSAATQTTSSGFRSSRETGNRSAPRHAPGRYALAASVLIACAAAGALVWNQFLRAPTYATALGEQRSVLLSDGTLITLNTATEIEVHLTEARRLVYLNEGEALFDVARDPKRPFDVLAGDTTIRAVGTQFNVDRRAQHTTVTVVEGKVLVEETPVAAAERVIVTAARVSAPERLASVAPVTAWTRRQLVFDRRPLGEVAEEFNRYNRRHILIENENLRQQEVTGVFQANDPESFMTFLGQISGVEVQVNRDGHHVVIGRGPN